MLYGGAGADIFAVEAEPVTGEWDAVRDFTHGFDRIQLQDVTFNHVGFGSFTGAAMDAIYLALAIRPRQQIRA